MAPKPTSLCIEFSYGTKNFSFMLIQTKKTAYLPLGSIRRLPIAFQPTFYSKVVDLVKGVNEPMLTDSSVILADKVAELNHIVESPKSDDSK